MSTTFVVIIVGAAVLFAIMDSSLRKRRSKIAVHTGGNLSAFLKHFEQLQIPAEIASAAHDYFKDAAAIPGFSVSPRDDLYRVYGICEEDLDDAVEELARRTGVRSIFAEPADWTEPLRTVEDIVKFVHNLRKQNPSGSA